MTGSSAKRLFGDVFNRLELRDRVLSKQLLDAAERFGDRPFADLPGGSMTFAQVPDVAARAAGALRSLGVGKGDTVAVLSDNRFELVATLWGQGWHGGIGVPLNPGHRASTLHHIVSDSGARVLVVQAGKLAELEPIAKTIPAVETIVVVGEGEFPRWQGPTFVGWDELLASAELVPPAPELSFADHYMMMYTSGTTGPSKGVLMSHHHHYCYAVPLVDNIGWGEDDHLYTTLPLFHTAALNTVLLPGLAAGARVTIRERFSASGFWRDVADCGATHVLLIGAMGNILMRQDVQPGEAEHRVRTLWCVPPPSDLPAFVERFRVQVFWQGWGMTEAYPNQLVPDHPDKAKNCIGRSTELFDLRVVDELDVDVPADGTTIGEIVVRPNLPYAMMTEYRNHPEATAAAFRNLWFHTGDLAAIDEEGYVYFWGRKKDAIRRRGENISAFELEQEVLTHPAVAQAAAIGVPSELGEEDVKIDVVLVPGATVTGEELVAHLEQRVPHFMLPRYVQFRDALPMTPSERVEKYRLKAEGLGGVHYDAGDRRRAPTGAAASEPFEPSTRSGQ